MCIFIGKVFGRAQMSRFIKLLSMTKSVVLETIKSKYVCIEIFIARCIDLAVSFSVL